MRLWGWFRRDARNGDRPEMRKALDDWRRDWAAAAAAPSAEQIQTLSNRLAAFGFSEDDVDVEREMLEALERVVALDTLVTEQGLPAIETGHRIVAADVCHYSAPASMPDEPAQPSGRLLLTSARAAFAGGASSRTVPWHAVKDITRQERDLMLIRSDRAAMYRFRCNSYGDALCAAFIASRLTRPRSAAAARPDARGPSTGSGQGRV